MTFTKALVDNIMSFTHGGPKQLDHHLNERFFCQSQITIVDNELEELEDEVHYWKRIICGEEDGYMYAHAVASPWLELNTCCRQLGETHREKEKLEYAVERVTVEIGIYLSCEKAVLWVVENIILNRERELKKQKA